MPNTINVSDFSLADTLESGQAFRWRRESDGWFVGVIGKRVVRLRQVRGSDLHSRTESEIAIENRSHMAVAWESVPPTKDSAFLSHYLGLADPLNKIIATFPDDPFLRAAVKRHYGLRLLRQEPWETLASFIASSTKQIVQIRQIVRLLCENLGEEIDVGRQSLAADSGHSQSTAARDCRPTAEKVFSFPSSHRVASASHDLLWNCKLGFRAKYLLATARMIDSGELDLAALRKMDTPRAREELMRCPGVGEKIADCTLLFAYGRQDAFPIDVWVERALRRLYFRGKRNATPKRLREFARSYFGPNAGYAQQYLFHYVRMNRGALNVAPKRG